MEPTKKTKLHRGTYYYVRIDPKKYSITVEPTGNQIHCETIGNVLVHGYSKKRMHQYGKHQGEMNLYACHMYGNTYSNWHNRVNTTQRQTKRKKANYVR